MHSDMTQKVGVEKEKLKSVMRAAESYLQGDDNNIFGNSFYKNLGGGKFEEISDKIKKKGQNPTSMGNFGIRSHRVVAGETLDVIAYNELGDANHWRHIAQLNNINNPFDLRPGQHLAIAPPP